jgi:D-sedoheptulose 7-phosphate isomerase
VIKPSTYIADQGHVLSATVVTTSDGSILDVTAGVREVNLLLESVKAKGKKVIVIGNGGSASIALHMTEDLMKMRRIRALAPLSGPMLTCLGNDLGFERVFSVPIDILVDPGDVVVSVSSSGNSSNVVLAAREAKDRKCSVVTFTGMNIGNQLRKIGDVNFYVPSQSYGQVESAHATLMHCVLDCV